MCGISGIMYKNSDSAGQSPVGDDLIKMLGALAHRGRDSTGITVAGEEVEEDLVIRLWTDQSGSTSAVLRSAEESVERVGGVIATCEASGSFLRLGVNYEGDVPRLAEALVGTDGVELHSIGESSEVIKDVGEADYLDRTHGVRRMKGTHGIGHVRMATESRVDISHSHPFWAFPFPDVTVVHNGQLTNYHKLKRRYEDQGHRLQTENDSEIIAVYLADKLSRGQDLEQALHDSVEDLDGTFTFLVSTIDRLGYAKDRWSAKPLVAMENQEVVALASEEVALRRIFSGELQRVEPQQSEIMTWSI